MTTAHRRARARETELIAAEYLAARIFPDAYRVGSGAGGVDVLRTPGVDIEVKARRDFNPLAWVRQASRSDSLPLVILRPDGLGPASVADWLAITTFRHEVDLMLAAGFGERIGP